jgi:transposase
MDEYDIKTEDWKRIYAFLKTRSDIRFRNEEQTRIFVESVYFIMGTGAQWRELPAYYGKWQSVHKRFEEWSRKGLWAQILEHFTQGYDGESLMIDTTLFVLMLVRLDMEKRVLMKQL